jgi:hypothetical protein
MMCVNVAERQNWISGKIIYTLIVQREKSERTLFEIFVTGVIMLLSEI